MFNSFNFLADGSFNLLSFIVALSVIVFIHEFGHYIVGRWCGIKAEVFSIGFGPVIFSTTDKHGTQWQVALLPLGGFVKFLKENESSKLVKSAKVDPLVINNTFDDASLLFRSLTVLAGPIANFILSFCILISFIIINGVPAKQVLVDQVYDYPFMDQKLLSGDRIISVDGLETPTAVSFYNLAGKYNFNNKVNYLIERDGLIKEIKGPHPFPSIIGFVALQSAAFEAGLKSGDLILAVNGSDIFNFSQLQKIVTETSNYPIGLEIWRDGKIYNIFVTPRITDYPKKGGGFIKRKLIGITSGSFFEIQRVKIDLLEASKLSVLQIFSIISSSLNGINNILIGAISTCNLQGPIGIASTAGDAAQQGIGTFLRIIAVLSTAIGMLNLFPIPMLDGGHLVVYGVEAITRKQPSEVIMKIMTFIGIFILLSLMITAISSDLFCP